jgi:iron complex outermembrane recepter protein
MNLRTRHLARLLAAVLLPSLAALSGLAQSAPARAASSADDEVVKLDAFTVTGSNIRRAENERALPVTIVTASDIEVRDASQPADLLMALPQVTGLPGNETATLGATARGDNSSVSLRGLPSSNTLILLNGRRLVPHGISQSEAGVPTLSTNVNQLPNRGIERIEVLRDGASSIYGTDAVTGVINYITKRDFVGTELVLRYGQTEIGDGRELRTTITHGDTFKDGKGRVQFMFDAYDREAIYARNRDFMAEADMTYRAPAPWNVSTNTQFNARSATSEYGLYQLGTFNATTGVFTTSRPAGIPASLSSSAGLTYLVPTATGVGFATTAPARSGISNLYYWNNNTYRVLQPDSRRYNGFLNTEYDLTDKVTLFADLNYYRAKSVTYREPDGITFSTDGPIIVPASNPWNPFGTRFFHPTGAPNSDGTPRLTGTPADIRISNKRLTDLDDRTATITNDIYRAVVGARGKLFDTWTWESAALKSDGKVVDNEANTTRKSLIQAAINQTDPARAFNPFTRTFAVQGGTLVVTGDYKNPTSVTDTFRSNFIREGRTGLSSLDFRASGDVMPLWGGNTLGAAFGGEYRYESYSDYRPPFAGLNPPGSGLDPDANDFLGFSPNSNTYGNRHVAAAYLETSIPLVGRDWKLPLVKSLELNASARFESYTDFGETTKPKLGVNWSPFNWMLVRASYNEGFHAPNLAQLFTGSLVRTATGVSDNYRSAVTGLTTDGPSNRRSIAAGNPDLKPEESKGKSAGIVIDVPLVKGLSFGVDYWEIRQTDIIASSGTAAQNTARDNEALQAATAAALAAGQSINAVDLGSGTGNYRGDPSIVRLPVTQADRDFFAAYNASRPASQQRAVVGAVDYIRISYFNRAEQFVNGFDFDATYRLPRNALGNFTFSTTWTYLNDFHSYDSPGASRNELRSSNSAAVGGASPKWRGNASVNWRKKQWSAGVSAYYLGEYTDAGATTNAATYESLGRPSYIQPFFTNGAFSYRYLVEDSVSVNAHVIYRIKSENHWFDGTSIRLGVVNAFDQIPPLSSDSRGYDPSLYNQMARGRSWSVQLTKRF